MKSGADSGIMIEQLQEHLSRPVLNFIQHNGALLAIFSLLGTIPGAEPVEDTEIDWEDGEPERLTPADPTAH